MDGHYLSALTLAWHMKCTTRCLCVPRRGGMNEVGCELDSLIWIKIEGITRGAFVSVLLSRNWHGNREVLLNTA
jgi:hypothetical protein